MNDPQFTPQIKICGLTREEEAAKCAELGADAIGLIFYPKSPRFITDEQARRICRALPSSVSKIGVFVDEPFEVVMEKVHGCGLTGVQLHGRETQRYVQKFVEQGLLAIKGLFTLKTPNLADVHSFEASAYLVECGKGKLPGGNAMVWNWSEALEFGKKHPFILAGGLSPENIATAISECFPDAVDVSSCVEISPGSKDLKKVALFIQNARNTSMAYAKDCRKPRTIFPAPSQSEMK